MADVSTLIANQTVAIDQLSAQADAFLADLLAITDVSFSDGFNIDDLLPDGYNYAEDPGITFPVFSTPQPIIDTSTLPPPEAPAPSVFSPVEAVAIPELTVASPVLDIPVPPSSTLPTSPGDAPEFVTPDIPAAPVLDMPTVPTFDSLVLPVPPSFDLPTFDLALPSDDLIVPSNTFEYFEAPYDSALLEPLKAKLLNDLLNGGYGIDTNDEAALVQRVRDRELVIALGGIDELSRQHAGRGFPLPPGQMVVRQDRAYQDMQDKVSGVSRDIYLERGKLYVENRQFTITEVRSLETVLIGFHNSVQERALNVAKATLESSLAIYDALVKRYGARLDAYKTGAAVFESRIRAELAKAEIYKTQMEGTNLVLQSQRNLVDIYRAQLAGLEATVGIYRTQMDAAAIRSQIERNKLDAFRSRIEAYTAQVQAKVAEFGMFRARIEGEQAKVSIYESQIRAYLGQVSAAETTSRVQVNRLNAEVAQASARDTSFRTTVAAYETNVRRLLDSGRLKVDIFRAAVDQNRALTDGYKSNADIRVSQIERTTQQNIQISHLAIENAKAKLGAAVEGLRFRTASTQYAAEKFYGQLTALIGTINTLAVQTAEDA